MTANIEENKRIVLSLLKAMEKGDVATISKLLAEDFVWTNPQHPDYSPLSGDKDKAHFLGLYDSFGQQMPNGLRLEIKGVTAEGDRVAVEAESFSETPIGTYNNRYHFLFKLSGGKLTAGKEYADSAYMKAFTEKARAAAG